jgi:hypothetical protein
MFVGRSGQAAEFLPEPFRTAIPAIVKACEAYQHHRPSGGLRDRTADGKIEAETAASVCNEIVTAGQIDAGLEYEPRLITVSLKKLLALGERREAREQQGSPEELTLRRVGPFGNGPLSLKRLRGAPAS